VDNINLPPAVPEYERQMLFMTILQKWYDANPQEEVPELAQLARLAQALGHLLDQVQTEQLTFEDLDELVPDDYAIHWQQTLDFLKILTENWPHILAATGFMDTAERRNHLLNGLTKYWQQSPPSHPVIAAGSTGSIPATSDLLTVIARMPEGMVVLPGVDLELDDESWDVLSPSHPQFTMKSLLEDIGVDRREIEDWVEQQQGKSLSREKLFREVMRPAETTDHWRQLDLDMDQAVKGLSVIESPGPREEAGLIALMLREVLETPGKTAALVTPDRQLARRVAGELARWQVQIDDSAGTPLFNTPVGVFIRLTAQMMGEKLAPVSLFSVLKHPLMAGGQNIGDFRAFVRRLEKRLFRGPRPAPGSAAITVALKNSEAGQDLQDHWQSFVTLISDFEQMMSKGQVSFEDMLTCHVRLLEALASTDEETGADILWKGDDGEAAAQMIEELLQSSPVLGQISPEQYPALLEVLMSSVTVRPRYGQHPRLFIWGPLEARLQHTDKMILAGLYEGVWPPEAPADPWMSRPMRAAFGLPSLEQKIGLSAQDFVQAANAPEAVLIRSAKMDGAPTVKSRWLSRLEALIGADWSLTDQQKWLDWYQQLDQPDQEIHITPPSPRPPVEARPRELSVTGIQTWMRDPYSLYAGKILNLKTLDPLDADPGAAEKGTMIHAALDDFMTKYPDAVPADAEEALIKLGEAAFGDALDRPGVWAFWWPRFCQIAEWFVDHERSRRAEGHETAATEISGHLDLPLDAGNFRLTAKADRIDQLKEGAYSIIDYKTGRIPTPREIHAGYAPQLPLEALILQQEGFAQIKGAVAGELAYWKLQGGKEVADKKEYSPTGTRSQKMDVTEVVEKSLKGLRDLVSRFDQPETPYLNNPRPDVLGYGEYDHLARTKEWQNHLSDEETSS